MIAIGLMSGTSADGVDAAAIELDVPATRVQVVATASRRYADEMREAILDVASGRPTDAATFTRLHQRLGDEHAAIARSLVDELRGRGRETDVIAMHGQTIGHFPSWHATLQIGDAARVALATGVPTVDDFRSADVAAGGEGAPLVPFADHVLFASLAPVAVLNIGGIANLTLIPTTAADDVVAFDTGPGNMLIDAVAREGGATHDVGGAGAARGSVDDALVREALRHPFFARRPPKSTGREEFGDEFARTFIELAKRRGATHDDMLASASEVTARTIAEALAREMPRRPSRLLVGGGGARNAHLVRRLAALVAPVTVGPTDAYGVPASHREAIAFAILGAYRLRGLPNTLPRATGASRAVVAGALHIP